MNTHKPSLSFEDELLLERVSRDPSSSSWLRFALFSALRRDPVDAVNDAEYLFDILNRRQMRILGEAMASIPRLGNKEVLKAEA